jgi:hypothetical protein
MVWGLVQLLSMKIHWNVNLERRQTASTFHTDMPRNTDLGQHDLTTGGDKCYGSNMNY